MHFARAGFGVLQIDLHGCGDNNGEFADARRPVVHNFMRTHFTTKEIPAVAIGILRKALSWKELLMVPMAV